jgi:hypothetical protein
MNRFALRLPLPSSPAPLAPRPRSSQTGRSGEAVAATPTTPAPAAPRSGCRQSKALQQSVQGRPVVGEIVTTVKIKNMSTGSINLLKADQEWYDKGDGKKRNLVTTATAMYRKPFLPGEVIELELRAPRIGNPDINRIIFSHANGKVDPKVVKAF